MNKIILLATSSILITLSLNAQNVLINGDFEAGTIEPWWVFIDAAAAAAVVDTSSGSVNYSEISNAGSNTYDIQLIQELSDDQITELGDNLNETYYLTFDAIVPESRSCNLFLGEIGGSWFNLANGVVFSFTQEQSSYSAAIKITQVFDAMKFGMEIGTSTVPVEFDNFMLSLTPPASISADNSFSREYRIFPNPASEFIEISAGNGTMVELYSFAGILIELKSVVNHSVELNVSDLPSGMYLIRLRYDKTEITEKIYVR